MLGWAMADSTGQFSIDFVPAADSLKLTCNYLGYEKWSSKVAVRDSYFAITMRPGLNSLPEMTVREKRLPITHRGDTTIFNSADFRDSTDRKVEELLSKIPGVEVNAQGVISVNGKPLHRLLVEGSDLFGADYQLGSKNINARDIGQVRVVDHYQDDQVLKSVNNSEKIVLDLRLEERVKSVIAGNLLTGGGFGAELKYKQYASLYRISRAHKTIFIGDVDNVATNTGFGGLEAIYSRRSNQSGGISPLDLYQLPQISGAGLPARFTDNSRAAFGTLRHESNLGKNIRIKANGVFQRINAAQTVTNSQIFVGDTSTYSLRNRFAWTRTDLTGEGEVNIRYLSSSERTSLELGVESSSSAYSANEVYTDSQDTLPYSSNPKIDDMSFKMTVSRELKPGLVTQLEINSKQLTQRQEITDVYPALDEFVTVNGFAKDFQIEQNYLIARNKWLLRAGPALLTADASARQLTVSDPTAGYTAYGGGIGAKIYLKGNVTLRAGADAYRFLFSDVETRREFVPRGRVALTYEPSRANSYRFSFATGRGIPPTERRLLRSNYLSGAFQTVAAGLPVELSTFTEARMSYKRENWDELRYFRAEFKHQNSRNNPLPSFEFIGDLAAISWAYGLDQSRTSIILQFSQFLLPLKSDFKISLRTGTSRRQVLVNEATRALTFNYVGGSIRSGVALPGRLRLNAEIDSDLRVQTGEANVRFYTTRLDTDLTYRGKSIHAFCGFTAQHFAGPDGSRYADGLFAGAKKRIVLRSEKELSFEFRLYNPFGRRTYRSQAVGNIFVFTDETPALRPWGLLTINYSL